MNGLLALPQWYAFMDNPSDAWLGFINAIYWLGMGVSFPLAAVLSNKYGRKGGIYVGYVFLVLGTALQTAANNTTTFILGRFFLGVAGAWYGGNVPLLINEIAYPTHRGIASSLYNCGWCKYSPRRSYFPISDVLMQHLVCLACWTLGSASRSCT